MNNHSFYHIFCAVLILIGGILFSFPGHTLNPEQDFGRLVSQKIACFLTYPEAAKKNHWEGIVTIKFLIQKDGKTGDVEITRSSGYPLLDSAAVQAVRDASPYPFPFSDRDSFLVEIPLKFGQNDLPAPDAREAAARTACEEREYAGIVRKNISLILPYPREARENGWQGTTRVNMTIDKTGAVYNVRIVDSSGYKLLDDAVLWAIENSAPLPSPLPGGKDKAEITLNFAFTEEKSPAVPAAAEVPAEKTVVLSSQDQPENPPEKKRNFFFPWLKREDREESSNSGLFVNLDLEKLSAGQRPQELKGFIQTALENNQPLQAAQEEVSLAKIKLREAKRNLYPAAKLTMYNTTGDVYKVDYEERELKLQLDHPLYYSGRLRNAYEQAKVNLAITQRNYDQQMLDVLHKTEVSYYTLITLRMNLARQDEIMKEAEKIVAITQKQFDKGVIIPLDLTTVQSWYERLKLLRDSINQEVELAYLNFNQVLNSEASPAVNLLSLEITDFDVKLPRCIYAAIDSRPEINLAKLTVKFQDYNKKMVDAKGKFTVDLTGSYGFYQGHYLTEPVDDASNWYVGFKVTRPLGANTLTSSISQENSEPRFGQSSPTSSQTISAEMGFLDNFEQMSEQKKAEIELLKAQNDLEEAQKNVTYEVQNDFFKYQKSLLEVKSALTQKKYREEEIRIKKTRVYSGEGSFPDLIETLVDFSEAENTYLRALGNYYIAVATLRKSTAYGLVF